MDINALGNSIGTSLGNGVRHIFSLADGYEYKSLQEERQENYKSPYAVYYTGQTVVNKNTQQTTLSNLSKSNNQDYSSLFLVGFAILIINLIRR